MDDHIKSSESQEQSVAPVAEKTEKKDRFLPISILIAAILIGGSVVFSTVYHGSSDGGAGANTPPSPAPAAPAVSLDELMKLGPRDAILGNANAPVTLIEYGDYQCPFCSRFFGTTESSIVSAYLNTGKVKMVFRNFAFLGPESLATAAAADCALDQNKLWPYHDALYSAKLADEQKGGGENDGFFSRAELIKLAQNVGLDIQLFTSCIDSNKHATDVTNERTAASNGGIGSTPTFLVDGTQILGAEPYATFQAAIEAALKKK